MVSRTLRLPTELPSVEFTCTSTDSPWRFSATGKSRHSASSGQSRTDTVTSPLRVSVPTIRFKLCTGQSDFSGRHLPGVPFDHGRGNVAHQGGAAVDESGSPIAGLFVTGWMKRGAAGLIGAARPDARQTVETLLRQLDSAYERRAGHGRIAEVLRAGRVVPVDWDGWLRIDAAERASV